MTDEIIDGHEVARWLKLDYRTVMQKARDGQLPSFRVGHNVRFRRRDIEEFIERQVAAKTKQDVSEST